MKVKFKKPHGFTLAEVSVSLVVISMIMIGVNTFLSKGIDFFRIAEAKTFVQRDARQCLKLINKYLRMAKASTVVISRENIDNPPYSKIYFETVKGDIITYYQSTTKLFQSVGKSTDTFHTNLLTDNLQNISFIYPRTDDDSILHISICLVKIPHPYIKGAKALQLSVEKVRIMND